MTWLVHLPLAAAAARAVLAVHGGEGQGVTHLRYDVVRNA